MSEEVWSREERQPVVDAYNQAYRALKLANLDLDKAGGEQFEALCQLADVLDKQVYQLAHVYLDGLPRQPLARCPYSGRIARIALDPYGLDGMFWHCDEPMRPKVETEAGPHFLSLTGAVRLAEAVETTSFVVTPGPGIPFVVPRVFERQDVTGVLSQGHVGAHLAYAVTYFAATPEPRLYRPNLWGTDTPNLSLWPSEDAPVETNRDYDFDLRPWIERRRLAWVAPGDEALTLRFSLADCPFLDLRGERRSQYLQNGKSWTGEDFSALRVS